MSRLSASSPDLELTLLDADDIRSGALDGTELLVMSGGDSRTEKLDLGPKGAAALGIEAKSYEIRYHGGPVLEPSTNAIADADFEIWGTYEQDFGKPGSMPEMEGRGAMLGGTYGKGRVFAFSGHPENFAGTCELVRGAFRYVIGRDVMFPDRRTRRSPSCVRRRIA